MITQGSRDSFPKEDFIFDPFGLHTNGQEDDSSTRSPNPPPQVNRLTRPNEIRQQQQQQHKHATNRSVVPGKPTRQPIALPPRLVVRFTAHEDVSSVAQTGLENEGSSEVFIQGKLYAQVTSSDALKNTPFCVTGTTPNNDKIQFQPTEKYLSQPSRPLPRDTMALIHVPKAEFSPVNIGSYSLTEYVRHMPLLVERRITIVENSVRVAVQVRSKLSNLGDMKNFTIAVAVPERVNSETVEVSRGDGVFDDLKRTIMWVVPDLPKGESFMVSAQAHLWTSATSEDHVNLKFPVLLRCQSDADQISNVELRAVEADGFPSSVSFSRTFSFRLLHRLP